MVVTTDMHPSYYDVYISPPLKNSNAQLAVQKYLLIFFLPNYTLNDVNVNTHMQAQYVSKTYSQNFWELVVYCVGEKNDQWSMSWKYFTSKL